MYNHGRELIKGNQMLAKQQDLKLAKIMLKQHGEETVNERINNLFKTRIGLMNTLTATQGWIQERIYVGTTLDEIKTKKRDYDECWKEFVNVHEQFIQLLVHEEEMECTLQLQGTNDA